MASDFLDLIETELARALRAVDRAAMLAQVFEKHPPRGCQEQKRLKENIRRAQAVRDAIEAAGIELPPLRVLGDREEPAEQPETDADQAQLTVGQIAAIGGLHRITVARWLQVMAGPIGEKYREARRQGRRAAFTFEEAQEIVRAGGSG